METATIHPLEAAGLGIAPFTYAGCADHKPSGGMMGGETVVVGVFKGVEVHTKPGGTCDYCGKAILNVYRVRSADGKTFTVGSDCILKIAKKSPVASIKTLKKEMTAARKSREAIRIMDAKRALKTLDVLKSKPHPQAWRASQGETMHDYCEWMMSHAMHSGKFDVAKLIEREIVKNS